MDKTKSNCDEFNREFEELIKKLNEPILDTSSNIEYIIDGRIPGSFDFEDKPVLNTYKCKSSNKDVNGSPAYDCPECGIVHGDYGVRPIESSKESWEKLGGAKGEEYYCTVCHDVLGHHISECN